MDALSIVAIAFAGGFFSAVAAIVLFRRSYRDVPSGTALIVRSPGRTDVTFEGAMLYPFVHSGEIVDVTTKTIRVSRTGRDAVLTKDDELADVEVVFFVRINRTKDDVLRVAQSVGPDKTRDDAAVDGLFRPLFTSRVIETVRSLALSELGSERSKLEDELAGAIGTDLNGYVLEQIAVETVARAPAAAAGQFR